jgi:hypothetical protein
VSNESIKSKKGTEVPNKEINENEIKNYFEKILELKNTGEDFPVDFDDVWMLVYSRRNNAVRELKRNFIQNFDYHPLILNDKQNQILLRRNPQQDSTQNLAQSPDYQFLLQNEQKEFKQGRSFITYKLSVPCLEFFIAKRVRPVFEVYRQVFHQAVDEKINYMTLLLEMGKRVKDLEDLLWQKQNEDELIRSKTLKMETDIWNLKMNTSDLGTQINLMIERCCELYNIEYAEIREKSIKHLYHNRKIWLDIKEQPGRKDGFINIAARKNCTEHLFNSVQEVIIKESDRVIRESVWTIKPKPSIEYTSSLPPRPDGKDTKIKFDD